jgi:hypothetical protein
MRKLMSRKLVSRKLVSRKLVSRKLVRKLMRPYLDNYRKGLLESAKLSSTFKENQKPILKRLKINKTKKCWRDLTIRDWKILEKEDDRLYD